MKYKQCNIKMLYWGLQNTQKIKLGCTIDQDTSSRKWAHEADTGHLYRKHARISNHLSSLPKLIKFNKNTLMKISS